MRFVPPLRASPQLAWAKLCVDHEQQIWPDTGRATLTAVERSADAPTVVRRSPQAPTGPTLDRLRVRPETRHRSQSEPPAAIRNAKSPLLRPVCRRLPPAANGTRRRGTKVGFRHFLPASGRSGPADKAVIAPNPFTYHVLEIRTIMRGGLNECFETCQNFPLLSRRDMFSHPSRAGQARKHFLHMARRPSQNYV